MFIMRQNINRNCLIISVVVLATVSAKDLGTNGAGTFGNSSTMVNSSTERTNENKNGSTNVSNPDLMMNSSQQNFDTNSSATRLEENSDLNITQSSSNESATSPNPDGSMSSQNTSNFMNSTSPPSIIPALNSTGDLQSDSEAPTSPRPMTNGNRSKRNSTNSPLIIVDTNSSSPSSNSSDTENVSVSPVPKIGNFSEETYKLESGNSSDSFPMSTTREPIKMNSTQSK